MKKNINYKCIEHLLAESKLILKGTAKVGESACDSCGVGLQLKSETLSIMSHELLTPLSGIIGMTELAQSLELPREARDLIFLAHASALDLLNTIQDVLLLSKIVAGNLDVLSDLISPLQLLEGSWPSLLENAQHKRLSLTLNLAADLPPLITVDVNLLGRVLLILIGNAIKFTEQGRITVRVGPQDALQGGLHICVADSGIGIAPEKLESIFAPFIQVDAGLARKYNGMGIGLAIAWQLINLMGGELVVDSELGKGSRFHVFLP